MELRYEAKNHTVYKVKNELPVSTYELLVTAGRMSRFVQGKDGGVIKECELDLALVRGALSNEVQIDDHGIAIGQSKSLFENSELRGFKL